MNGVKRYIDQSAVFVGRLVKEVETEQSLLERFSQYGPVVSHSHHHQPTPHPCHLKTGADSIVV